MVFSDPCPCLARPMDSPCCDFANNSHLCACADLAISAEGGMAAPS